MEADGLVLVRTAPIPPCRARADRPGPRPGYAAVDRSKPGESCVNATKGATRIWVTLGLVAARLTPGSGAANVATGLPVLDHLLTLLARSGGFDLGLELPPGDAEAEVDEAGRAL